MIAESAYFCGRWRVESAPSRAMGSVFSASYGLVAKSHRREHPPIKLAGGPAPDGSFGHDPFAADGDELRSSGSVMGSWRMLRSSQTCSPRFAPCDVLVRGDKR